MRKINIFLTEKQIYWLYNRKVFFLYVSEFKRLLYEKEDRYNSEVFKDNKLLNILMKTEYENNKTF